ncbi:MAG: prolyl-tRNA synthetase associated domain-containing protein [Clostridiales bacterium]|nr:prolyl-tRNA synthetase associated domain-containing protein [Clostridiales bacterium]
MGGVEAEVYARLRAMGVAFEKVEHAPVHTIEDCKIAEELLGGIVPKNLFLTPRNESAFYLLLTRTENFRTADVSKKIGSSRLSFASAERLMEKMRTLPGAISPLGLAFPEAREVKLLVDRELLALSKLLFHPCVNTATLSMSADDFFEKFLPAVGHAPTIIDIGREGQE